MASAEEVAWAAGLFEGEGSFTAHNVRVKYWNVGASIQMTDRDMIERFARIVGVGYVEPLSVKGRPAHYKPLFRWRVHDTLGVQAVIALLLPWLGDRRKARALEVLGIARTIDPGARFNLRSTCKNGHALDGENVAEWEQGNGHISRRCRTCRRAAQRAHYYRKKAAQC